MLEFGIICRAWYDKIVYETQEEPLLDRLTDISTIRGLCRRHGFSFSKGFGQHFLSNPGICPKICEAAGVAAEDDVLEIGPGFGTLTRELAARARRVAALEVDRRLLPVLGETLDGLSNVRVVHGDVMKTDLAALMQAEFGGAAKLCANLPYNLTSPILMKLLESRLPLGSITVMVQKEAAERITAAPGTRGAGAITYAVHYYAVPRFCFSVSPGSFYPAPKVKSAVITLNVKENLPLDAEPRRAPRLFSLIRAAFGQRRKTLANAASAGLAIPRQEIAEALAAAGLGEMARPEELSLEDYIRLEKAIWADPF